MVWSQTWSWSISWTVWPRLSREEQWFGPNRSWGPTVYETLDIHDPQFSQWPLLGCARYRWGGWDSEELSDCWLAHNQHGVEPSASSSSIESRLEPRSSKLHTKCFDGKLVSPALLTSGSTGVQALPALLPDSRLPTLHQFQWPLCYHWGNLPKFMWSIRGCATHTHTHTHTHTVSVVWDHITRPPSALPWERTSREWCQDDFWSPGDPGFHWSWVSHFGEASGSSSEVLFLCLVWSASREEMMKWRMVLHSFCHLHANLFLCFPFARGSPELG